MTLRGPRPELFSALYHPSVRSGLSGEGGLSCYTLSAATGSEASPLPCRALPSAVQPGEGPRPVAAGGRWGSREAEPRAAVPSSCSVCGETTARPVTLLRKVTEPQQDRAQD